MTKEFVPYEQALALKELGFDEICFGYYDPQGKFQYSYTPLGYFNSRTIVPLYQQAFRWFREKHELYHSIIPYRSTHDNYVDGTFHIEVRDSNGKDHAEYDDNEYFYEEAELAYINKLIEEIKK